MTYRYDFDRTRAGDFRLSRADFLIVQEAYRLLSKELDQWNQRALEHGAVKPPYKEEVEDINHMIEWGEAEAARSGNMGVDINSVSVGSLRYMKAALILMISKRQADYAEKARAGWPSAPLKSLTDGMANAKAIAADIKYEPCDVLWELVPRETSVTRQDVAKSIDWDVFVSHASEDKEGFVRPLVQGLQDAGLKVWFDEFSLKVGDSLRRSIDRGLASSRFGVVVISPDFLRKEWPQRELDGLVSREIDGVKVILPVWHRIGAAEIRACSPTLADKVATSSDDGLERVISELLRVIDPDSQSIKRSAGSGERSAKVSQETLDRDRPIVTITDYELTGYGPPPTSLPPAEQSKIENYRPVVATFKIRNVGPSLAIMEGGVSSVAIFPCPREFPKGDFPAIGDYDKCRALFLQKTTLRADEFELQASPKDQAFFTPEEYGNLLMNKSVVVFYGIVRYNGIVKREKPYETSFFLVYQPAGGFIHEGRLYLNPEHRERNRIT